MTDQRFIIEMGMGNDLHGMDYTKAAGRAIQDALRHSSIPMFGALEIAHSEMRVQVSVGVQEPELVDTVALAKTLPRGRASVSVTMGGLNVVNPNSGDTNVIATAAVEAFLPSQVGKYRES
jgi:uncharacterized protein (TIGR02058 family)